MDWNDVMNIRKAREQMHPNNTSDAPAPTKNRGINSPVLNETEQLIFRMRTELIDYIVAHGLVDGLIWDGVIKKTEGGKIVITADMVDSLVGKLNFFKKEDVLKLLEVYLPENNYVQDENYVHTDNNFTDEEIARIDKAISDIIEIKEHEQECDEENRQKFEEIDGRLSGHDASITTISSQIAIITSSTIRQQGEIDKIEEVIDNHLKDYEHHLQDFNEHVIESSRRFDEANERMDAFNSDLTELEEREKVNEQNIASLIAADADINRHMREIDDNHRKLTASAIILASEIHRVEDKVDKNERNNQHEHDELENRIQAEQERAIAKESEIEEKVSMLTASSIVADIKITELSEALAEETERATEAERSLGEKINRVTASSSVISGQIDDINEAIEQERSDRESADNELKSSIVTISSSMAILSSSVLANRNSIDSIKEAINKTETEVDSINARLDTAEDSISANTTVIQDHAGRISRLEELARGGATIYAMTRSPIKIDLLGVLEANRLSSMSYGHASITVTIYNMNNPCAKLKVKLSYSVNEILDEQFPVTGEVGVVDGLLNGSAGIVYGTVVTGSVRGELELLCSVITDESWNVIDENDISTDVTKLELDALSSTLIQIEEHSFIGDVEDGNYIINGLVACEFNNGRGWLSNDIRICGIMNKRGGVIEFLSLSGSSELYESTVIVCRNNNLLEEGWGINICVTSYADSINISNVDIREFFRLTEKKYIEYVKLSNELLEGGLNSDLFTQIGNYRTSLIGISFSLNFGGVLIAKCYVQGEVIGVKGSLGGHLVGELVGADESIDDKTEKIMSLTVTMHGDESGNDTLLNISAIVDVKETLIDDGTGWSLSDFNLLKIISNYVPIRINKKGAIATDELVNRTRNNFIFPEANQTFIYYSNILISFNLESDSGEYVGKEIQASVNGTMRISVNDDNQSMYLVSSFTTRTDYYEVGIQPADVIGERNLAIIYSEVISSGNTEKDVASLFSELFLDVLIMSNGGTSYVIKNYKLLNADYYKIN